MPLPDVVSVMSDPESPAALDTLRVHRARVASRVGELEQQLARLDEWLHGALQELDTSLAALDESATGPESADDEPVQPLERAFLGLFGPPGKP
jgi:hypothetical protein